MYADVVQQREVFASAAESVAAGAFTATGKRRAVQVTVDGQGNLTEIKFPTSAYRTMAGGELGTLLLETITTARRQAIDAGIAQFAQLMPANLPLADILGGSVDVDAMLAEAARAMEEARATANRPEEAGDA
ncbi:YbaB/EbfC family nucleoid-associated protein [Micromonospora marina]|uniref:YbaB/EbfC family nucleoid-associated protein n=1 Tax=Micromonospora marina TaxID=307120 RepID=UPI0034573134